MSCVVLEAKFVLGDLRHPFYSPLSCRVLTIPAIVDPPDFKADITFFAGDWSKEITSPINSSFDFKTFRSFDVFKINSTERL